MISMIFDAFDFQLFQISVLTYIVGDLEKKNWATLEHDSDFDSGRILIFRDYDYPSQKLVII